MAVSISRRSQSSEIATTLKRGGRQQDKEMRPGPDVAEDDALEITAGDAGVIKENIEAIGSRYWEMASAHGTLVRR